MPASGLAPDAGYAGFPCPTGQLRPVAGTGQTTVLRREDDDASSVVVLGCCD
jgi:hypothetical protein